MNNLDKVMLRQALEHIKASLANTILRKVRFSKNRVEAKSQTDLKTALEEYLETLKAQGIINSCSSTVGVTKITWNHIYPSLGQRLLARLTALVFKSKVHLKQHWYHTVLPFDIKYHVYDYTTDNSFSDTENTESYENKDAHYVATLRTPHDQLVIDTVIYPTQAIDAVTFKFKTHNKEYDGQSSFNPDVQSDLKV